MIFGTPEQHDDEFVFDIRVRPHEYKVFAYAAKLIACETLAPDKFNRPTQDQTIFAQALANSQVSSRCRVVPIRERNFQAVGNRLIGPWDPLFILQQSFFDPEYLPDFIEIANAMGGEIMSHVANIVQSVRDEPLLRLIYPTIFQEQLSA